MSYEQVKEILFDIIIIQLKIHLELVPWIDSTCMRFHTYLGVPSKGYGMLIHV